MKERRSDVERVVLLGYMCSGKSVVGEALARRLDWSFLDFDVEIEKREDRSISSIVDEHGEEELRAMEAALTDEIANERFLVISPGGGWITQPELLDRIRPGTVSVWLSVSPEETVRRLMNDSIDRPLKDHPDPLAIVSEMLAEREPLYRRAAARVPGDGRAIEEIAFEIERMVRTNGND